MLIIKHSSRIITKKQLTSSSEHTRHTTLLPVKYDGTRPSRRDYYGTTAIGRSFANMGVDVYSQNPGHAIFNVEPIGRATDKKAASFKPDCFAFKGPGMVTPSDTQARVEPGV